MFYLKVNALILIALIIQAQATAVDPIVETRNGKVLGKVVNNGANNLYYAFGSIPFAEPPVGDLRFEPPQRLERRWSGILNGTSTELPLCVQLWTLTESVGTEDCLYLNVFTPKLPRRSRRHERTQLLPVMVFIHGGGLMYGAANYYGEQYIMASKKMLLVTIHHRLNIFGYLSTEDDAVPGNMGFKDQSLALRWVHENIGAFGGDKRKVLFSGWSGGGASISYHMVSEMTSTSWFNSAASFSGSALCPCHTIYPGEARRRAGLMAQYLNCSAAEQTTSEGIKRCLKSKTSAELMREMPKLYTFSEQPFSIFGAVIENSMRQRERFLTGDVETLMEKCRAKRIPWLITRTADDGALFTAEFLKKDANGREGIYELNDKWLEWAPAFLFMNMSLTPEERRDLAQNYKERYFGSEDITMENYKNLDRMMNDEFSTKHVQRTAESFQRGTRGADAYGYVYDNPAPFGLGQFISGRTDLQFGTMHGDDMYIIFNSTVRQGYPYREDELRIQRDMIDMLAHFAETGLPVYAGQALTKLTASNNFRFDKITSVGLNLN